MPRPWTCGALGLGLGLLAAGCLSAQEVDGLGGITLNSGLHRNTYAYQFDYRDDFGPYVALSESWINEGHLAGHLRDGAATQIWLNLPFRPDRLSFSIGAGFYTYFDTVGTATAPVDRHGTGPIFSASISGEIYQRLFWRATYQRIAPHGDTQTNTATLGLGLWLGGGTREHPQSDENYVTEQEITLYGGRSIVNSFGDEKARAWGVEYRTGLLPHIDWTLSWLNEGDPLVVRRNGLATQVWPVNTFFGGRLEVGMGLGAYIYVDHKNPPATGVNVPVLKEKAALAGILSPTLAWRMTPAWEVRATFNRIVSNYNRDSDVILLGLGYRFGHHFFHF